MNDFRTTHNAVVATEDMPDIDARKSTHPPGTRDACPTKAIAAATGDLWGSRLGCREGGRQRPSVSRRPADNPFAGHRIESLAFRYNGADLQELHRRLQQLGGRAAIVGPKGSGKTTLVEQLASELPGEPVVVRIAGGCRHPWRTVREQLPRPVQPDHLVLVDGAERFGTFGWHLLLLATRPARCLVATLHRPGRLPTLIECHTDPGLLRDLVEELAPTDAQALEPGIEELFRRHRGNIRLCFRELYDVYAGRAALSLPCRRLFQGPPDLVVPGERASAFEGAEAPAYFSTGRSALIWIAFAPTSRATSRTWTTTP